MREILEMKFVRVEIAEEEKDYRLVFWVLMNLWGSSVNEFLGRDVVRGCKVIVKSYGVRR